MLTSPRPLEEKMALFWHGHFAVSEAKVRDYRKTLDELRLFQQHGTGNFRDLMVAVAKGPGMLSFLDAGVNVKGAANENFAREIMEMFTMGVGHYTEKDVQVLIATPTVEAPPRARSVSACRAECESHRSSVQCTTPGSAESLSQGRYHFEWRPARRDHR